MRVDKPLMQKYIKTTIKKAENKYVCVCFLNGRKGNVSMSILTRTKKHIAKSSDEKPAKLSFKHVL